MYLRLNVTVLDYAILAVYFATVIGIGFAIQRYIKTDTDFLEAGRSMPAWICGLAFIGANLGALDTIGLSASAAQYGLPSIHFFWAAAVPAMLFLGLFMMPFYYGSRVHSVPDFLRARYNNASHLFTALAFAFAVTLLSGVNLYALALVLNLLLGLPIWLNIILAACIVLVYITLAGLRSAMLNEVLQFFVICAGLLPVTVAGLVDVGGWGGLKQRIAETSLGDAGNHAWTGIQETMGTSPLVIILGLGFVLGFGYWCTSFAEIQRALSANSLTAARNTPLIAIWPKMVLIPVITIIPGLIALVTIPGLANTPGGYNNAVPAMLGLYLPTGILGLALTGLLAAFMSGMAANVTGFNTVVTNDLWKAYVTPDRPASYYLRFGRYATIVGVLLSIATAFIAAQFSNIMNYLQLLGSVFNGPLFATFLVAIFWKRATPWGGFFGLVAGMATALGTFVLYQVGLLHFGSPLAADFTGAIYGFVANVVVTVLVSFFTKPKPIEELRGLVWGMANAGKTAADRRQLRSWWKRPVVLGVVAGVALVALNVAFR